MKGQTYVNVTGLSDVLGRALQGHWGVLEFQMWLFYSLNERHHRISFRIHANKIFQLVLFVYKKVKFHFAKRAN